LSVVDNLLLGRLPRGALRTIRWSAARRRAQELLDLVGLDVDPRAHARELTLAQLQILEMARALSAEVDVLIMDEPTSTLSGAEIERLFQITRRLREQGVAVIYISHHLAEIFELADEVTVLRDGKRVTTTPVGSVDLDGLVQLMVGRELQAVAARSARERTPADPVLKATDVHVGRALAGVTLAISPGEILCVTGAIGSGRRELARCLAGVQRPDSGSVTSKDAELRSPRDAIKRGIVFLPDDRKREGLLLDLTVLDNLAIGVVANGRRRLMTRPALEAEVGDLVARLRIKAPSLRASVRQLSGGNQQKVIVGRWLATGAEVFIFDEPTAGIDVGSKAEIYSLLRQLAAEGKAVVLFSSDYEEIKIVADRVVALRRGKVVGELPGADVDSAALLRLVAA
jgi:ABC-type sugar transport system ATPase subunit